MQIKKQLKPKSEIMLTIEVEPKEYQPMMERAAQKISLGLKIEGFRPGKAPYDMIKQRVGEGEIMQRALNNIISQTLTKALVTEKIEPVGHPEIKVTKMAPQDKLIYEATVTILPTIKLAPISEIKIKKPAIKIEDKQVDQLLKQLAQSRAKEILEDRPAKDMDLVKMDCDTKIDKVAQEGGQQKDFSVYLGEKHMVPGFEEQILGLKAGDEKKFEITFPKNYFQKNMAGKKCEFEVKIKGVYKLEIPEINDEFAKGTGKFKNLDELKNEIRENLKLEAEAKQDKELENKMFDELIKKSKFSDIADKIVNSEIDVMINEIRHDLEMKGLQFNTWLENMNKKEDDLKQDFKPQAERRVKSALIIRALAHQEKIKAGDKDINEEIQKITDTYKDNQEILAKANSQEYYDYMMNSLTSQKVVEFLKEKIIK